MLDATKAHARVKKDAIVRRLLRMYTCTVGTYSTAFAPHTTMS